MRMLLIGDFRLSPHRHPLIIWPTRAFYADRPSELMDPMEQALASGMSSCCGLFCSNWCRVRRITANNRARQSPP